MKESKNDFFNQITDRIQEMEGVISCSISIDGIPVVSKGDSFDHEKVAAMAEDIVRFGSKVTKDLGTGTPSQVIIESKEKNILVFPLEEVFVLVVTNPGIDLGKIKFKMEVYKALFEAFRSLSEESS